MAGRRTSTRSTPSRILAKYARQTASQRKSANRAEDRGGLSLPVQIQKVRPKRHRNQRALFAPRRACRRSVRHPLDARGRSQSRTVADADELRRSPRCRGPASARGSPTDWGPKTRTCPRSSCLCPRGYPIKDTENWQSAFLPGSLSGDLRRHAVHPGRQADRQYPQPDHHLQGAAPPTRSHPGR